MTHKPLEIKKRALFIPRLLLGLDKEHTSNHIEDPYVV